MFLIKHSMLTTHGTFKKRHRGKDSASILSLWLVGLPCVSCPRRRQRRDTRERERFGGMAAPTRGYKPSYDETVKILLIGESSVGKSSLLIRFADDSFSPELLSTVGIDYKIKTLEINGKRVKMEIWDTAGQERFRTITTAYYRGATGIMLVYDVTSEKSFKQINEWLKLIDKHASENVAKVLVANKCDVSGDRRVVSKERVDAQAAEFGLTCIETSALSGFNVEEVFKEMGKMALNRVEAEKRELQQERAKRDNGVDINAYGKSGGGGGGGCCK